jgi:hypothetical protein
MSVTMALPNTSTGFRRFREQVLVLAAVSGGRSVDGPLEVDTVKHLRGYGMVSRPGGYRFCRLLIAVISRHPVSPFPKR